MKTQHAVMQAGYHKQLVWPGLTILLLSFLISSSYRGIAHDEGLGGFRLGAMRIFEGQDVLNEDAIASESPAIKDPARLMYLIFIAIGFKFFGLHLVAFHIFPYLLQILNPVIFFVVAFRFFKNVWWGFGAALLFLSHPFNLVYLNQQHNHPFFICFLLCLLLVFEYAVNNPKFLILFGVLAALLIITRFEDGTLFVAVLYGTYLIVRWKKGIPVLWLLLSVGSLCAVYSGFALYFGFPVHYPLDYIPQLFVRQAEYGSRFSFVDATKLALRHFLYWYFCGKAIVLVLLGFLALGTLELLKKRMLYPLAIFYPYFFFLLFVYNGRFEIINLPVTTFSVPGFLLILVSGIRWGAQYLLARIKTLDRLQKALPVLVIVILLGFFSRAAYSLATIVEDGQPASTMWHIVKNNPPFPGSPLYKDAFVRLSQEEQLPVKLREEIYKAVRGNYRSWYVNIIGKYAFEHGLPEQARARADFFYTDDYQSKQKWEQDRKQLEGESPLWNGEHPERIGAFPAGKGGSFVYQFEFPKPIEHVTISDKHTQWGFGDITRMWTSTDGENWTLGYDNWNVRYTKDVYYQFFDDEFDGQTVLFIKYYFYAGDKARKGNDNRGASLEEFSLAVKYIR